MPQDLGQTKISILVELKEFRKQLATMGPETEKNAKLMSQAIIRQLKEAEKAARASSNNMNAHMQGNFNKMSAAANALAAQVGGSFARMGAVANSAFRPVIEVAASFGTLGTGIAGVVAGVGLASAGFGTLVVGLKTAADAAIDLHSKNALLFSHEDRKKLIAYEMAMKEIRDAWNEIVVSVGPDAAQMLVGITKLITEQIDYLADWKTYLTEGNLLAYLLDTLPTVKAFFADIAETVGKVLVALSYTPVFGGFGVFVRQALQAKQRLDELSEPAVEAQDQLAAAADSAALLADELHRYATVDKDLVVPERIKEIRTEFDQLQDILKDTSMLPPNMEADLKEAESIAANLTAAEEKESRKRLENLGKESREAARIRAQMLASNEDQLREVEESERESAQERQRLLQENHREEMRLYDLEIAAFEQRMKWEMDLQVGLLETQKDLTELRQKWESEIAQEIVEDTKAAKEAVRDLAENGLEYLGDYMNRAAEYTLEQARAFEDQAEAFEDAMDQAEGAEKNRLKSMAKTSREQSEAFKKEAWKQWDAARVVAAAKIEIDTILMGVELATSMAFLGPGAMIAGFAMAAGTGAMALEQLYAQPPPEFPMGLTPDHTRVVAVQEEESVLNRRATRELGVENVSRLNQGMGMNRETDDDLVDAIWALARSREHAPRVKRIGKRPRR